MTAVLAARRGIVTPQGVVLDLEVAGLAYRTMARLIDLLILVLLGTVIGGFSAVFAATLGRTASIVFGLIGAMLIVFGYPIAAETYWRGRTVGKSALGLRVVTLEGGPTGFREAAIRSLFQLVDMITLGVSAILSVMATSQSQRLGDLAAGTFVVRDPKSTAFVSPVPFTPPMGAEAMVASMEVSRLRPEQERVIRSFLLRVGEFTPDARADLARQLAASTAARLGHNVNYLGDNEVYLVSVMAARQLREGGLAQLAIKS